MKDKEVKEMLQKDGIPERLEPANIKAMLDEKAVIKKRSKISVVSRFTAIAAACAVVSGTAVYFANKGNDINKKSQEAHLITENGTGSNANNIAPTDPDETKKVKKQGAYMSGASDYSQVYKLFSESYEKAKKNERGYGYTGAKNAEMADAVAESSNEDELYVPGGMGGGGDIPHSETFDQEANVREADIVKTDGKNIYYVNNAYKKNSRGEYEYAYGYAQLHITSVSEGSIKQNKLIDVTDDIMNNLPIKSGAKIIPTVENMYLYNDMAIIIVSVQETTFDEYGNYYGGYYKGRTKTAVLAYSTDESHKLLSCYYQAGSYNDVRIAPDGYMYLISYYDSQSYDKIKNEDSIEKYIPYYGTTQTPEYVEAGDILLPEKDLSESFYLNYMVIGSVDLNNTGKLKAVDTKALASYSGDIYCAPDNLYTAVYDYREELPEEPEFGTVIETTEQTKLTRFAISKGNIEPAASTAIEGRVNDQFSMSEYDGYFRVAATRSSVRMVYKKCEDDILYAYDGNDYVEPEKEPETETDEEEERGYYSYDWNSSEQDNILYVLDIDMNKIGEIDGFGKDESVKSVNFNKDMAYVVTYEQTDPLFAIDLSTPETPKILDEYKMLGYSSYMQRWDEDHLFGFGPDANKEGRVTGVKMVMFDNSDPNELKQVGNVTINKTGDSSYVSSEGVYDRKALLVDPEKNLIAFPVTKEDYGISENYYDGYHEDAYCFYKYENGGFVHIGDISNPDFDGSDYYKKFKRVVYIGNYVYVIGDGGIIAADIDNLNITSDVKF